MYLHCPQCRLEIKCRASYLALTNCPRCLARAMMVVPLFASALNGAELRRVSSDRGLTPAAAPDALPRRAPHANGLADSVTAAEAAD